MRQRHKATSVGVRPSFKLETLSNSAEGHLQLKAAMRHRAQAALNDFPAILESVKDLLRQHDPIGIMSCFAIYGGLTTIGSKSGPDRKLLKDIQQHHAEQLQAIMLTIPVDQWGKLPVVPKTMQAVFDSLPQLTDTFFLRRMLDADKVTDEQELAVLQLQDLVRFKTMGVRNWGYFSEVVRISKELYGAIDAAFAAQHGFSCTDLIEVMTCTVSEFERRQTEHFDRLRKVLRGRSPSQIFRLYFRHVPGLSGSAEEMLAALPGIDADAAKAAVMGHYDLRLADCVRFKPDELAALSGRTPQVVERILRAISLAPAALSEMRTEYIFLGNPIWSAPTIDLGEAFFVPMPHAVFSHIHRIMERLVGVANLKEMLEKTRAGYLQHKLEAVLRSALPSATITPGANWKIDDQQFETDVMVVLDRTIIAVEAKSNRLTAEGLRGAPARVKRHVQDLVLDPSIQSQRLKDLIIKAQSGDATSSATVKSLGIDPGIVDHVIRLSVTLDDLSVLSAAEGELKRVGWVPLDHQLAPTVTIADLLCVTDILDKPLLMLHYFAERTHIQKAFNLLGDELDFLGLYLETGFNLGAPDEKVLFSPSGMSGPIDRYYTSRDASIPQLKPRPKLTSLFTRIIDRLNDRRPPGWTTAGLYLLSAASPAEQRRLEHSLDKLRKMVRKNFRVPTHINSVHIQPPQQHKARVGFYLFPEQLRSNHKRAMEQICTETLTHDRVEMVVLFGRSTEKWDLPYEAVVFAKKRERQQGDAGGQNRGDAPIN